MNNRIAQAIMETEKYDKLMRNYMVNFDKDELDDYILCQNELNINTFQIQKGEFEYFVKVDESTVRRYLEKMNKNLMVYGQTNPIKRYEQIIKKEV